MTKKEREAIKNMRRKDMTKKALRELHASQRGSWNGLNPCSRVVPNRGKNAYDRNKAKRDAKIMTW